jgi:hypothetical protein
LLLRAWLLLLRSGVPCWRLLLLWVATATRLLRAWLLLLLAWLLRAWVGRGSAGAAPRWLP